MTSKQYKKLVTSTSDAEIGTDFFNFLSFETCCPHHHNDNDEIVVEIGQYDSEMLNEAHYSFTKKQLMAGTINADNSITVSHEGKNLTFTPYYLEKVKL